MSSVKKTQFKGVLMLFLTAFIWGTAFVAQKMGMDSTEPFTFNGLRMLLGAAVLAPIIIVKEVLGRRKMSPDELVTHKKKDKKTIIYGMILGVALCGASNLQQYALTISGAGKVAFISAFYMLFVPVLGLILRKRVPWITWICVLAGIVGLYFLCVKPGEGVAIGKGEWLSLGCSILFAIQILLVERFVQESDGLKLSCVQFTTCGVLTMILMAIFEHPEAAGIKGAIWPLLYSGLLSCGIAYTFQILGQRYTESTVASLIMCMESVFGVLASALILHEKLDTREIIGCVIMFVAIIVAECSPLIMKKVKEASKKRKQGDQNAN